MRSCISILFPCCRRNSSPVLISESPEEKLHQLTRKILNLRCKDPSEQLVGEKQTEIAGEEKIEEIQGHIEKRLVIARSIRSCNIRMAASGVSLILFAGAGVFFAIKIYDRCANVQSGDPLCGLYSVFLMMGLAILGSSALIPCVRASNQKTEIEERQSISPDSIDALFDCRKVVLSPTQLKTLKSLLDQFKSANSDATNTSYNGYQKLPV